MKFTVSTKPLSDGLNLAIVNANVSKFYRKSCLAQLTVDGNTLKINVEAAFILSQITLKGKADISEGLGSSTIFVDSLLLKQLVSTFESPVTTLEFTETGLILHSGKSKFTLPKLVEGDELSLSSPRVDGVEGLGVEIDKSDWKFIKDYQMYAIAMSFIHPVYTRVWVGAEGDVLVGDFDNSLFTHSKKNNLGTTCLLSDTIINLFNSLPEGAKLAKKDKSYVIQVSTDGFNFASEFTPQYEDDENVGSYNSDIILTMMNHPEVKSVSVSTSAVNKFLSQADLLSSNTEDTITFSVEGNQLTLHDNNVDCKIDVDKVSETSYSVQFKTALLKSVMSNYTDEKVNVSPMEQGDEVVGITVWTDSLTTVLAGID